MDLEELSKLSDEIEELTKRISLNKELLKCDDDNIEFFINNEYTSYDKESIRFISKRLIKILKKDRIELVERMIKVVRFMNESNKDK